MKNTFKTSRRRRVFTDVAAIVGGLSVNTDLQVLDTEKNPIEGLYAAGNASGDLRAINYPINMVGSSNGRCFIRSYLLGRIMAGKEASGEAVSSEEAFTEPAVDADETVYVDGEYVGVGQGRNGEISLTVKINNRQNRTACTKRTVRFCFIQINAASVRRR